MPNVPIPETRTTARELLATIVPSAPGNGPSSTGSGTCSSTAPTSTVAPSSSRGASTGPRAGAGPGRFALEPAEIAADGERSKQREPVVANHRPVGACEAVRPVGHEPLES